MSKYLVLKSSNSPENKSYNRFAPPSAQAFQEDAFQSFNKSPREKGWLSRMSADLSEELDALFSSRKDGAHLREVIVWVRDIGREHFVCVLRRSASPVLTLFPTSTPQSSQDGRGNCPLLRGSHDHYRPNFRNVRPPRRRVEALRSRKARGVSAPEKWDRSCIGGESLERGRRADPRP